MKKHVSAGCYVIRENKGKHELLVIHRTWEEEKEISLIEEVGDQKKLITIKLKDAYVLPKGHVKENETLEEAAKRETAEETGYSDIKIVKYLGSRNYILPWKTPYDKTDNYYLAILQNNKTVKQDLDIWEKGSTMEAMWVELNKGFKSLTWENNPEFLKKIKEYIKEHTI